MFESLFAILLAYHSAQVPERYRDESEATRQLRLRTIAQAQIDECTETPIPGWPFKACVALGTTIARWESGIQEHFHDGTRKGPAGELCLFQLHRTVTKIPNPKYTITKEEWENTLGIDYEHTRNCIRLGMRIVRYHIYRCKMRYEGGGWGSVLKLFAEYHHPSNKCWAVILPMSGKRATSYQYILSRLPKE